VKATKEMWYEYRRMTLSGLIGTTWQSLLQLNSVE